MENENTSVTYTADPDTSAAHVKITLGELNDHTGTCTIEHVDCGDGKWVFVTVDAGSSGLSNLTDVVVKFRHWRSDTPQASSHISSPFTVDSKTVQVGTKTHFGKIDSRDTLDKYIDKYKVKVTEKGTKNVWTGDPKITIKTS